MEPSPSHTAGDTTRLIWDKNNGLPQLIAEQTSAGEPLRQYLHGAALVSMTAGGQEHYYHRDGLGSITNLTGPTGQPQWAYTYEPYGTPRTTTKLNPQAPNNPIGFTGQYRDNQTGNYHLRARDLDPDTGRFTATDPLPNPGSAYAYANNQPTTLTDPSGLCSVWPWKSDSCAAEPVAKFLDGATGGISTKLAGEALGFDPDCTGWSDSRIALVAGIFGPGKIRSAARAAKPAAGRTFQTYTKTNPATGQVYSGRTSGTGTPLENIARRDSGHPYTRDSFGPAVLDRTSDSYGAIRGREQQLIELFGGRGVSANKINGIGPRNPNGPAYRQQGYDAFGPLP